MLSVENVATPATEAPLLDIARAGTAAHVEQVVRAWRRVDRVTAAQETARRHQHRALHIWVDEDGMLVIRGRLSPEVGAVVQRGSALAARQPALEQAPALEPA